jgi:hypothetical protein
VHGRLSARYKVQEAEILNPGDLPMFLGNREDPAISNNTQCPQYGIIKQPLPQKFRESLNVSSDHSVARDP